MASMEFRAETRQHQTLSPRLQHAVRLLQLSSLDFAHEVQAALGKNPFLEGDDLDSDTETDRTGDESDADESSPADADSGAEIREAEALAGALSDADGERDVWQADDVFGARTGHDGEISAMDLMAVETSLASHLHGQLNLLPLSPRDSTLAKAIVDSLDDDGYLRIDLDELIAVTRLDPLADAGELQIALRRVQSLEPLGVGARTVAECLKLQLSAIDCPTERELADRIVNQHLERLAAKDLTALARTLGRSVEEIDAVCARIRRLDPRPGWRFGSAQIHYLKPDVIVKKVRGEWVASLNPSVVPKVRLNHVYAEMFQRHRSAHNAELSGHLQEARWTVSNVEQRFATILSVAQAIVKRQRHFLDYGPMAMKPLGLREIADEVGLHESTVSRVTNNKYMSTPLGVFELKYFFSRAMVTASGGEFSGTAIRGLIKDMIAAERSTVPLSDAEIARLLAKQGLVVARRTVTKYRQLLGIEPVDRRRTSA